MVREVWLTLRRAFLRGRRNSRMCPLGWVPQRPEAQAQPCPSSNNLCSLVDKWGPTPGTLPLTQFSLIKWYEVTLSSALSGHQYYLKRNHCKFCNDTWKWVCFNVAFIRKLPFLRNLNTCYGEIQSFLLGGLLMCGREACWWGRGWERGGEWRRGRKRRHQEIRGRISEWTCFCVGLIVRKQLPQCALRWELTLVNSLL